MRFHRRDDRQTVVLGVRFGQKWHDFQNWRISGLHIDFLAPQSPHLEIRVRAENSGAVLQILRASPRAAGLNGFSEDRCRPGLDFTHFHQGRAKLVTAALPRNFIVVHQSARIRSLPIVPLPGTTKLGSVFLPSICSRFLKDKGIYVGQLVVRPDAEGAVPENRGSLRFFHVGEHHLLLQTTFDRDGYLLPGAPQHEVRHRRKGYLACEDFGKSLGD